MVERVFMHKRFLVLTLVLLGPILGFASDAQVDMDPETVELERYKQNATNVLEKRIHALAESKDCVQGAYNLDDIRNCKRTLSDRIKQIKTQ